MVADVKLALEGLLRVLGGDARTGQDRQPSLPPGELPHGSVQPFEGVFHGTTCVRSRGGRYGEGSLAELALPGVLVAGVPVVEAAGRPAFRLSRTDGLERAGELDASPGA